MMKYNVWFTAPTGSQFALVMIGDFFTLQAFAAYFAATQPGVTFAYLEPTT